MSEQSNNDSPRKNLEFLRSRSEHSDHLNSSFSNTQTSSSVGISVRRTEDGGAIVVEGGGGISTSITGSSRRSSLRYEPNHTRLRSTFVGDTEEDNNPLHDIFPVASTASSEFESYDSLMDAASDASESGSGGLHRRKTLRRKRLAAEQQQNGAHRKRKSKTRLQMLQSVLGQIPAIVLIAIFHLMIGIPFGVSYFPVGWRNDVSFNATDAGGAGGGHSTAEDFVVHGPFPLPGKEALGIRMFLFSTIIGQIVFTFASNFANCIGLQMVENVPFTHALSNIVIHQQGYGMESLSTLFVLFGVASVIVGATFYLLGRYELGRIVYFFPMHVLVGCIGGIGVYIAMTGLEVTMDASFQIGNLLAHLNLLRLPLLLEVLLRVLERVLPRYTLLAPIYFCMITPIFYVGLFILQYPVEQARDEGYFFPAIQTAGLSDSSTGEAATSSWWDSVMQDEGMFDMFKVIDFRSVSWSAVFKSLPTMLALVLFSLIHVPINIPAFAISSKTEVDMNQELRAHGYSNVIAGICGGGLQNYMAYTQSVVYSRSGGTGQASGIAVAVLTSVLFFTGPTVASFIPRCMAGALLLHVGIDLFLEGVYDSFRKFDNLEYGGIWVIVVCMTLYGMEAAMLAGVVAALSTYAAQSITHMNPVRGSMLAVTLRSSHRNRNFKASKVLDHPINGRSRIVVIQLQSHLFFGNLAMLNSTVDQILKNKHPPLESQHRRIVIFDFTLVSGIDSSAAQGLIKLKNSMHKHNVDVCIFVCGSEEGFPCEYNLSEELTFVPEHPSQSNQTSTNKGKEDKDETDAVTEASSLLHGSSRDEAALSDQDYQYLMDFSGSFVIASLDLALIFAENTLIAWDDPLLLDDYEFRGAGVGEHIRWDFKWKTAAPSTLITDAILSPSRLSLILTGEEEEKEVAIRALSNLYSGGKIERQDAELLFSKFEREVFVKDEYIWRQNDVGNSAKLLVSGMLVALLENEADTSEIVFSGNLIGELGLVQGSPRFSSLQCISDEGAILYSLSRESYNELIKTAPHLARYLDLTCIQYLANRVQHVSNRIFETRCLPI